MIEMPKLMKPQADAAPRWFHIVVAGSMALSAISALVGSLSTSNTMKELVKENARLVQANATPMLEFSHGNAGANGRPELNFTLANVGTGPARVVWFELSHEGQPVAAMHRLVGKLHPAANPDEFELGTTRPSPRMLPAGKDITMLTWPMPPANQKVAREAWEKLNVVRFKQLKAQACYCSVLDACWITDLQGEIPRQVPSCDATGRTQLQG
ncbi:hypothetical protein [Paucibacter soli]|uniref:hypothetical protein n=1 Tax=Paucibacter soli TaxID=3133433 RepID=UPI0030A50E43